MSLKDPHKEGVSGVNFLFLGVPFADHIGRPVPASFTSVPDIIGFALFRFLCSYYVLKSRYKDWEMRNRDRIALLLTGAGLAAAPALVLAAETITYRYDARGRLIGVERSGSVNTNIVTNYSYDKADNRVVKKTTGSPNPPPP
jgi:hypothetical protein